MSVEEDNSVLTLAQSYALDAVSAQERVRIERTLLAQDTDTQEVFSQTVRHVQETMAVLSAADAVVPAPELRSRVLGALDDLTLVADGQGAQVVQLGESRRLRWRALSMVAAAVVLIAGGIFVGNSISAKTQQPQEPMAQSQSQFESVDVPGGGSVNLVISHSDDTAYLVMSGIIDPAPGTVYQMWLIPERGSMVSAGIMTADDVRVTTKATLNGIDRYRSLGFSIEPAGGSLQPSSPPFVQIPLV